MSQLRITAMATAIAAGLMLSPLSADAADSASDTELRDLVRKQAARIEALEARLNALEARSPSQGGVSGSAEPSQSTALAAPEQAAVAAAIAETRRDDLALLQAQVEQLAENGGGGADVTWRDGGPEFKSQDGLFTFRPRGRVMVDFASTHGSDFSSRNIAGTEMRAVRLGAEGTIAGIGYKIDADFADNEVEIKDAYLSYDTKIGTLPAEFYVGNKLKDRSIDGATTLTRTPFMERNAVASVGAPETGYFGLGTQAKLFGRNWHLTLGVTGDDLGNTGDATDSLVYSVRAHWNPVESGNGLLHLGGWYFYEELGDDVASINKTPRIGLNFNDNVRVSAGSIPNTTSDHAYGLELGGTFRNLWAFGEYTEKTIRSSSIDSVEQKATSVYAGWLITGEKPGFSSRSGLWGTTRVLRPINEGGWGALELAVRYDDYDFTDFARGGDGESWTLGLNWYLNNWSRVMLNYVHWTTNNKVGSFRGEDSGDTLGIRAQVTF